MSERWANVDAYVDGLLAGHDAALVNALNSSEAAKLPSINVTAAQGKLLHLLARSIDARRILEIGTLGGYSTIWLARALPAGGATDHDRGGTAPRRDRPHEHCPCRSRRPRRSPRRPRPRRPAAARCRARPARST